MGCHSNSKAVESVFCVEKPRSLILYFLPHLKPRLTTNCYFYSVLNLQEAENISFNNIGSHWSSLKSLATGYLQCIYSGFNCLFVRRCDFHYAFTTIDSRHVDKPEKRRHIAKIPRQITGHTSFTDVSDLSLDDGQPLTRSQDCFSINSNHLHI